MLLKMNDVSVCVQMQTFVAHFTKDEDTTMDKDTQHSRSNTSSQNKSCSRGLRPNLDKYVLTLTCAGPPTVESDASVTSTSPETIRAEMISSDNRA